MEAVARLTERFSALKGLTRRRGASAKLSAIAVDFGVVALRALQTDDGSVAAIARRPSAVSPASDDPMARVEDQIATLREWHKGGLFKTRRVVCGLPSDWLVAKHFQIEAIPGLETDEATRMMAAEQMSVEPDKLVHRSFEVGQIRAGGVTKTEVISLSSPAVLVGRLLTTLRKSGFDLVGIHAAPLALAEAFKTFCDDATVMLVDIGPKQSNVTVLEASGPKVIRQAPIGFDQIDAAIAGELEVSTAEARRAREHAGTLNLAKVAESLGSVGTEMISGDLDAERAIAEGAAAGAPEGMTMVSGGRAVPVRRGPSDLPVSEVLEELAEELMVSVRYHRGVFPSQRISRVIFTGGGSRCTELCRRIAERLGIPAQVGDPLAATPRTASCAVELDGDSSSTPDFAVALGLSRSPTDL